MSLDSQFCVLELPLSSSTSSDSRVGDEEPSSSDLEAEAGPGVGASGGGRVSSDLRLDDEEPSSSDLEAGASPGVGASSGGRGFFFAGLSPLLPRAKVAARFKPLLALARRTWGSCSGLNGARLLRISLPRSMALLALARRTWGVCSGLSGGILLRASFPRL